MTSRTVIVTEGPASQAILEALCRRVGVPARVLYANGKDRLFKDFARLLRVDKGSSRLEIVVPDLHPHSDCTEEASRWRSAAEQRSTSAKICLAIWETESWLLADPRAIEAELGLRGVHISDAESIRGRRPSELLAELYRQGKGYGRGLAFDKRVDGVRLINRLDLDVARGNSPSLHRFLSLIGR